MGVLGHLRTRNLLMSNDDVCCSVLILRARGDEMPGQAGHDRLKISSPFGYAQGKLCFAPQDDVRRKAPQDDAKEDIPQDGLKEDTVQDKAQDDAMGAQKQYMKVR